jgi:hypothetical protein
LTLGNICVTIARTKTFQTSIEIASSAEQVWSVLTDAARYTTWNSTVDRVEGSIARGNTVTVHAKISPGRTFPVRVTQFDAQRSMTWSNAMPLGLFKGERVFTLSPSGAGRVRFAMKETYSGLLAPVITKSIPDLQPVFDQFAADLKAHIERASP